MWRKSANDREISEKEVGEKTERILASLGMTKITREFSVCGSNYVEEKGCKFSMFHPYRPSSEVMSR